MKHNCVNALFHTGFGKLRLITNHIERQCARIQETVNASLWNLIYSLWAHHSRAYLSHPFLCEALPLTRYHKCSSGLTPESKRLQRPNSFSSFPEEQKISLFSHHCRRPILPDMDSPRDWAWLHLSSLVHSSVFVPRDHLQCHLVSVCLNELTCGLGTLPFKTQLEHSCLVLLPTPRQPENVPRALCSYSRSGYHPAGWWF